MRLRRTAVAALLAAGIVVPAVTTAAVAFAQPATTATVQKAKAPKPVKTKKPVRIPFAASGKVTAVDAAAGTVTVQAKGGTKDVHKRTVTVTVASNAKIKINDKVGTLAAVQPGAKITVTGTRSTGVYTATRVQVSQRTAPVVTPSPTPTTEPGPTPTVSPAPTTEPSLDPEPSPDTSTTPDDKPSEDTDGDLSD